MEDGETVFLKIPDNDHSCLMVEEKVGVDQSQLDEAVAAAEVERSQFRDVAPEKVIVKVREKSSPCSTRPSREDWLGHILRPRLTAVVAVGS